MKKVYYWSGRHDARCTEASQAAGGLEVGVPRVRVAVSSLYTYVHMHICIYAYRHLGEEDHDPAHEAQPVDVGEHTSPVPRLEHLELAHREARQPLLTLALGEGLAHAARGRHLVRVRARVRVRG